MMFSGIDLNSLLANFHVNLPGVPELPPPSSLPHFIHTLIITRPLSHIITSNSGARKQAGPSVLNTWALRCLISFKYKSRQATLPCFNSSRGSQCPDSMKSPGGYHTPRLCLSSQSPAPCSPFLHAKQEAHSLRRS